MCVTRKEDAVMNNVEKIEELSASKRLPEYREIPNVGLYLEQVVKYINESLEVFNLSITHSMLSNYVKKGYIAGPIKKLYYADQIADLIFIVVAKQVLNMENIASLLERRKSTYSIESAYNYFRNELEYTVKLTFEKKNRPEDEELEDYPYEKNVLRSVVIAVSHILYLNYCFENSLEPN